MHLIPPGVTTVPDVDVQRDGPPTLLTVARLEDEYKGHDVVLRALKSISEQVPEVAGSLSGKAPCGPGSSGLPPSNGVRNTSGSSGRCRMASATTGTAVHTCSSCRAGCRPKAAERASALSTWRRRPTVCRSWRANVAGARDAVEDGVTGMLVDPTDPLAVADAATRLLLDGRTDAVRAKRRRTGRRVCMA